MKQGVLSSLPRNKMNRGNQGGSQLPQAPDGAEKVVVNVDAPFASSEGKQPTYTTVGSIYNPSAAAPLQPPTRRPRTRRFPPLVQSPPRDPFQRLPSTLLSALPIKDRLPTSPPIAEQGLPEYSPLQQNYDRAVSPSIEKGRFLSGGRSMLAPSIRSGNIPPPPGFHSTITENGKPVLEALGDSDSIASEDTLASSRITVKGLTNLASYPNPMQKAAQNTLARARAVNLTLSRAGTPSFSVTSDFGKDRVTSMGSAAIGTPQPLTAGPPGQRQLRPSTLDGGPRTVGSGEENLDISLLAEIDWPRLGSTAPGLSSVGDEQPRQLLPPTLTKPTSITDPFLWGQQTSYRGGQPFTSRFLFGQTFPDESSRSATMSTLAEGDTVDTGRRHPRDTLPVEAAREYYPRGLPANYSGRYNPIAENWVDEYPQQQDKSARRSQEMASEQQARMNWRFYAGVEALTKDIHQVAHEHDNRSLKNKIGIIGEGRKRFGISNPDRTGDGGRSQPVVLSMEEANRIPHHVHAEPLLSMAFASLLRYKEMFNRKSAAGDASPGNLPPDPNCVDESMEGNKSLFETQKAEQPKKRRVIKRVRRGY